MTANVAPVVVGVDGSEHSLAAARHAAAAAARRGVELHLVHGYLHPFAFGSAPLQPYPVAIPEPSAEAERMLDATAEALRKRHPGLVVTTRQVFGGPAATLVAESERAELIFVGSRGRGGFAGMLLGSVSSQVAAHAHCPVVVVRLQGPQAPTEETEPAPDRPVLVGVDGSDLSGLAVRFAFTEAALRGAPLVAVHVYWTLGPGDVRPPGSDVEKASHEAAERLLAEQVAEPAARNPGVPVEERLIHNLNVEQSMIDASTGAGLVVVGSRGRGGFAGLLLGSVSQALVHHSHCPVAVVHPRETRPAAPPPADTPVRAV